MKRQGYVYKTHLMDWCTEDLVKTLKRQLNKLNYEEYDNYNQPTNKQLLNNN